MKRLLIPMIVVLALLIGSASAVFAVKPEKYPDGGKPWDVITMSNGFPSGEHETLNIHGKKADYECIECIPDPGVVQCNVINIPEYTDEVSVPVTITYVSGKKVKIDELTVFDSCAGFDNPGQEDGAEVWLPYEELGYYVIARAHGKPAKGDPNAPGYTPRRIIFQNAVDDNPTAFTLFGDVENPDQVPFVFPLGVITKDGAYKVMSTNELGEYLLVRFDSEPAGKGRGKTMGKEITDMFLWSGTVFQPILDLNRDGSVDYEDVEYNCWWMYDYDGDGVIEDSDLDAMGMPDPDTDGNFKEHLASYAPCSYDDGSGDGSTADNGIIEAGEFEAWLAANETGYVFPPTLLLDLNQDGMVTELDAEYACWGAYDTNSNGIIDYAELLAIGDDNGDGDIDRLDLHSVQDCAYDINNNGIIDRWDHEHIPGGPYSEYETWVMANLPAGTTIDEYLTDLWEEYTDAWVFTIADLVYSEQVVTNEGIKNLQIRFYPVATTNFGPVEP